MASICGNRHRLIWLWWKVFAARRSWYSITITMRKVSICLAAAIPPGGKNRVMKKVLVHTDGSCLGNPGPGGWAAILHLAGTDHRKEICGAFRLTTNNRMEILAAVRALEALREACEVELFTDSQYLRNAVEKGWLGSWRANGWLKADRKPVLNADLWRLLLPQLERHNLRMRWLKGHSGHAENERCDFLARTSAQGVNLPPDTEFENIQCQRRDIL